MTLNIQQDGSFRFVEAGSGEPLLLLHGLFGALSNFEKLINDFQHTHRVVVPILPILELPPREVSVGRIAAFVSDFVEHRGYHRVHVLGNSLGGHIALLYALQHPERVQTITLTGSSGLFEKGLGSTMPQRGNYDYIKARTEFTFYDPAIATKELVDEVFNTVNDRIKGMCIVAAAKSAIRHNLANDLPKIIAPTLLIWGQQDNITPPFVGEEFHQLIPNSELHFLDKCGHAPMMERPDEFNAILTDFLNRHPIQ